MKFYLTTAIPYVNAAPHLGFALELVQADVFARWRKQKGDDVRFVTGTDDNALKNVLSAEEAGVPVGEFVARNAEKFRALKDPLALSFNDFISTTEERHVRGAQRFWEACRKDIYEKEYRGLYCVGCEEFKTEKELVDDRCPEHPNMKLEEVEEKNYFFKLTNYEEQLKKLIVSGKLLITPETRKNEVLSFVEGGLHDFSISRSVKRAKGWGIPVPDDPSQVMYVWFDALTNYVNALGYADDGELFKKYWQENEDILHVIGKGVSRFHAVYWPAMLLSAGLRLPRTIFVHGYLTVDGKKISKSLGNVVDPFALVKKYGTDAVRYYLLREIPTGEDGDFSEEKFRERYNGDLANGLGNFASRILALASKAGDLDGGKKLDSKVAAKIEEIRTHVNAKIEDFKLHEALTHLWELIAFGDGYVNEKKPWENHDPQVLFELVVILDNVAALLQPFLPETAEKITSSIEWSGNVLKVKKGEVLFPRLS
ncbi:MAG: methionine--tRNA ligase [Candidatus Liptonbacteria bacterium]|nr:methionine--tRNA ligase [Candidatus Liptonbacteria bacterium]